MDDKFERTVRTLMMRTTQRPLLFFDVEIVNHCNLNCKSCASFSPLAKEKKFLDIDNYEKDLKQLSKLAEGEMHHINILGGEPLLHPQVVEFLKLTRKYFPIGIIRLITNGILLKQMEENFWDICRESRITVAPTKYPIKVDYDFLEKKAKEKKVMFQYFGNVPKGEGVGGWVHPVMNLNGERNEVHSFLHCWQANDCSVLKNGRIYPCPVITNISNFNETFGVDFKISDKDSIDIYKVDNLSQIMSFLASPVPFCRYCNTFQNKECDWDLSNRDFGEWT